MQFNSKKNAMSTLKRIKLFLLPISWGIVLKEAGSNFISFKSLGSVKA